ncbi:threonine/homoserine/homoserine lactone efflux protein [Sinorhizobium fredii]|uniref:Lysine exporter protein LysE/YggA n=1 Tax=Sinorhizobium fredii (strain USDA 257) TaxID=1185652 RepID=I3X4E6_SINF2|nr:LysE family translocator [Sinorhizobium fredii]AFL50752.1 lysine exporter protein LysE/YggA [Sinorhizobium fredii USDA 257]
MSLAHYLSMGSFALAASISPGPVNIVALTTGLRHGFRASMGHVTGATVGFTALLLLSGLGLAELLLQWPGATRIIGAAGVAFLVYLAWKLWRDDGRISDGKVRRPPSLLSGAAQQWLNPKAWIAAIAGMGAFGMDGGTARIWLFSALYFVVCYASIAAWAYAGARLRHYLDDAGRMRAFNRAMAALVALSALYLAFES